MRVDLLPLRSDCGDAVEDGDRDGLSVETAFVVHGDCSVRMEL